MLGDRIGILLILVAIIIYHSSSDAQSDKKALEGPKTKNSKANKGNGLGNLKVNGTTPVPLESPVGGVGSTKNPGTGQGNGMQLGHYKVKYKKDQCVLKRWTRWQNSRLVPGVWVRFRAVQLNVKKMTCPDQFEFRNGGSYPATAHNDTCDMSSWGKWKNVNGKVFKQRSRRPTNIDLTNPMCDDLTEVYVLEGPVRATAPLVVDCELSDWTEWVYSGATGCKARGRSIVTAPTIGGAPCGPLIEIASAEIDCVLGPWGWFKRKIAANGQCYEERIRSILVQPNCCGEPCGDTSETRSCPIFIRQDCELLPFTNWAVYPPDTRYEFRFRVIVKQPANGGLDCPDHNDLIVFRRTTIVTNVDCVVGLWFHWDRITRNPCEEERQRNIIVPRQNNGADCPPLKEKRFCPSDPSECVFGNWTIWHQPLNADYYMRSRDRIFGGRDCGPLTETRLIVIFIPWPTCCVVSEWSQWRPNPDGSRTMVRSRRILCQSDPTHCPPLEEIRPAYDCIVGKWSDWHQTAAGHWRRFRLIEREPEPGGEPCPPNLSETSTGCIVSHWTEWRISYGPPCCMSRFRRVLDNPSGDVTDCNIYEFCQYKPCPACEVGPWSLWSRIPGSASCISHRRRSIINQPALSVCPPLYKSQRCRHCVWGNWGDWRPDTHSPCREIRNRTVAVREWAGGNPCIGEAHDTRPCPTCIYGAWGALRRRAGATCVAVQIRFVIHNPAGMICSDTVLFGPPCQDCRWGGWREWYGWKTVPTCQERRTRFKSQPATGVGLPCQGPNEEHRPCPPACEYGTWSPWIRRDQSICVADRARDVTYEPPRVNCPDDVETRMCVDCEWGRWRTWGGWTPVPCRRQRVRFEAPPAMGGGLACVGPPVDYEQCHDCAWNDWRNWEPWSAGPPCRRQRRRSQIPAIGPGQQCVGVDTRYELCRDCILGPWRRWGAWSSGPSCRRQRIRVILVIAYGFGTCGPLVNYDHECPYRDCSWKPWQHWAPWSRGPPCERRRIRTQNPAVGNGKQCEGLAFTTIRCRDCFLGPWSQWGAWSSGPACRRERRRTILVPAYGLGACVGPFVNYDHECPYRDCSWNTWQHWAPWSRGPPCERQRIRTQNPAIGNGQQCQGLAFTTDPCRDCILGPWHQWGAWSNGPSCRRERRRTISVSAYGFGTCGPLVNYDYECPYRDCSWNPWQQWAPWSLGPPCERRRIRTQNPAVGNGKQCQGLAFTTDPCRDCILGPWHQWGAWSNGPSCRRERRRTISVSAYGFGTCGPLVNYDYECPYRDCSWNPWQQWAPWSRGPPCERRRIRTQNPAVGNGKQCQGLAFTTDPCRDCILGPWHQWGAWSNGPSCRRERRRTISVSAYGFGTCGPLVNYDYECPYRDCSWNPWQQWAPWSRGPPCERRRIRTQNPAVGNGKQCQGLAFTTDPCRDCILGPWHQWGAWSNGPSCRRERRRTISVSAYGFGTCGPLVNYDYECPYRDCSWNPWQQWAPWSRGPPCERRRIRTQNPAVGNGKQCQGLAFTTDPCRDCILGPWHQWGAWSNGPSCRRERRRTISVSAYGFGTCGPLVNYDYECPYRDCSWNPWQHWAPWSRGPPCERRRIRTQNPAVGNGKECQGLAFATDPCRDCVWDSWNTWSQWSYTPPCSRVRSRTISSDVYGLGQTCSGPFTETDTDCPVCEYGPWGLWVRQTGVDCISEQRRTVIENPLGLSCIDTAVQLWCVDCTWGPWSNWTVLIPPPNCLERKTRSKSIPALRGGRVCPGSANYFRQCRDCEVGPWSSWTYDTQDCLCNERNRTIITQPSGSGQQCPELVERRLIETPKDCRVSSWQPWENRPSEGVRVRIKRILAVPEDGGEPCPPANTLEQRENIDVDCRVSQWAGWSRAPSSSFYTRIRHVLQEPKNNGQRCPTLTESRGILISVDCQVSTWGTWSREYDFPFFERLRTITTQQQNNGLPCPSLYDLNGCDDSQETSGTARAIFNNFLSTTPRDLVIIVDTSARDAASFQAMKNLAVYLVENMCGRVGQLSGENRVAVVELSQFVTTMLNFDESFSNAQVEPAIRGMGFTSAASTCISEAFVHTLLEVMLPSEGMRTSSTVTKQVLVITDGLMASCGIDDVLAATDVQEVAEVFAVVVGPEKTRGYVNMLEIVSLPKNSHLYAVDDVSTATDLMTEITQLVMTQNNC